MSKKSKDEDYENDDGDDAKDNSHERWRMLVVVFHERKARHVLAVIFVCEMKEKSKFYSYF